MARTAKLKRIALVALILLLILFISSEYISFMNHKNKLQNKDKQNTEIKSDDIFLKYDNNNNNNNNINNNKNNNNNNNNNTHNNFNKVNYRVHAFYYAWYGNPQNDGEYYHWNHNYISHWDAKIAEKYIKDTRHIPPEDIGANFYPELGPYSSADPEVVNKHLAELQTAGVGVLVYSWYPPTYADKEGIPWDKLVTMVMDIALNYSIKITFHIEPYESRTVATIRNDIKYLMNTYGAHPSFYLYDKLEGTPRPLIYIYDSYLIPVHEWKRLLTSQGDISIRGTNLDCNLIGLLVESKHKFELHQSGFNGFYTYFASNTFTFGSSPKNWADLSKFAKSVNLLFIPSIGPGYIDTSVRPWNAENTKDRQDGRYYEENFKHAISHNPLLISITSYNEWHEGTQIESAVPKANYLSYLPKEPNFYLKKTKQLIDLYITDP